MSPQHKRILLLVFLTILLDLIALGLFLPVLGPISLEWGGSVSLGTALQTVLSLGTLSATHWLGRLSDQKGRRGIILLSLSLSLLGQGLTVAAALLRHFPLLFLSRFLTGVGLGNLSVAQAVLSDISPPQQRRKRFALIGIAFGLGFTIGPACGALIGLWIQNNLLFWLACLGVGLSLVNWLSVFFFFPETRQLSERNSTETLSLKEFWKDLFHQQPLLKKLYLAQFIHVFAFIGIESLLAVILVKNYHLPLQENFKYFLFLGIMSVLFNGLFSRRSLPLSEVDVALLGQLTLGVGLLLLLLSAPSQLGLLLSLCCLSLSGAFFNPSLNALLSRFSSEEGLGRTFGMAQTLSTLGRIVGPASFGFFYDCQLELQSLWISFAFLLLGATFLSSQRKALRVESTTLTD